MDKNLLFGFWRLTLPVPPAIWRRLEGGEEGREDPLTFMSEVHHQVRDYAVLELTRSGKPLSPQQIAGELSLPLADVQKILDDLEHHKTFIYRTDGENVTWAYPVTVEPTPHRLRFASGAQVYAA